MVVLDTCALIWWTLDPEMLSPAAAATCDRIGMQGGAISSISIWEVGIKIKQGKLDIGMSVEAYADRLKRIGGLDIIPVDEAIWLANLSLDWEHRDPADRTIVATALQKDAALVTKDDIIRSFYPKTIW